MLRRILLIAGFAAMARSQTTFEVASVKLTQHGRTADGWSYSSIDTPSPGSLVVTNASMEECIRWAYDVNEYQVVGPEWLNSDAASYDIMAKAPPDTPRSQMRRMLQALLAERFHLALHRETRNLPAYELTAARNGPKPPAPLADARNSISSQGGSVKVNGATMTFFAATLSRYVGKPVFDKTGLTGAFSFTFDYAPDDRDSDTKPSIFTAVEQQLGLKLTAAKGPVDVLVIDRADKTPTEN